MKLLSIVALALVASAATGFSVNPPTSRSLEDDFNDFVDLLPLEEIVNVAVKYFLTDKDVQLALQYMMGPEFSAVWDQVFALKEVRDVLDYLEEAGVDAYAFFNDLAGLLGLNPVKPSSLPVVLRASTRGLNDLVEEVLALLPKEDLLALFEKKLATSPEFKAFFDKVQSTEFQNLVEFFNNSAELQSLFQKLRDYGVDVDAFFELVKGFFGWGF